MRKNQVSREVIDYALVLLLLLLGNMSNNLQLYAEKTCMELVILS